MSTPACGTPGHVMCVLCGGGRPSDGPHDGCLDRACECVQQALREALWDAGTLRTERDAAVGAACLPFRQALWSIATRIPPSESNELAYKQWKTANDALVAIDGPDWRAAF